MTRPPEPPPEGVLIEQARREAGLSVRESARRAAISEGWWRQVVKGYQSLSGGAYGTVRGVPADTVARMADATGRVSPERLATEGERPDAAEVLAKIIRQRDTAAAADAIEVVRRPPPASLPDDELPAILKVADEAALEPFTADAVRSLWLAIGVDPGRDVRPMAPELLAQIDATYTAAGLFSAEGERMAWGISQWPPAWRLRLIAIFRMTAAEALSEAGRRNAVLIPQGRRKVPERSHLAVTAGNPAVTASLLANPARP